MAMAGRPASSTADFTSTKVGQLLSFDNYSRDRRCVRSLL
uniref:IPS1 riboregulator n=1 Tax=Lolium multiflorum TaxID=4521 RepID=A5JQI9_LOLMU|nr:IPS1 riboregulator [Lolium multiflorum]